MKTFTEKAYSVVAKIPRGKVATYKSVATAAGNSVASRAVGTVMRKNSNRQHVPCHRVVGSDGKMHGYAFGKGEVTKISLLKKEGVKFLNKDTVDLSKSMFDFHSKKG
jgi:methylated-DNA-protein-cysteine methyltransferase-like protein